MAKGGAGEPRRTRLGGVEGSKKKTTPPHSAFLTASPPLLCDWTGVDENEMRRGQSCLISMQAEYGLKR